MNLLYVLEICRVRTHFVFSAFSISIRVFFRFQFSGIPLFMRVSHLIYEAVLGIMPYLRTRKVQKSQHFENLVLSIYEKSSNRDIFRVPFP